MSPKKPLLVDPKLFTVPGGTKGDVRRLTERAEKAQDEGTVRIVDVTSDAGQHAVAQTAAPTHKH